ncbi:MAG TPA: IS30 family transposase [Candidatus Magasanikbacteria bacterium]|nr:IS30 family transposase [Candidatus Magasanikbacteria bacterium]
MPLSIKVGNMSNELTFYERQQFQYWLRTKQSLRNIAKIIRRDHTILSKEIERNANGDRSKYRADITQKLSDERKHKKHKGKLDKHPELKEYVVSKLKEEWSPNIIAGKLKQNKDVFKAIVSHKTIYQYIYEKDVNYERLYRYLKQGKKKRQKRCWRKKRQNLCIPERKSVHVRPKLIDERMRFGDWESDSVLFSKQKEILSVQIERKSKLVRITKLVNKTAEETFCALIKTAESVPREIFQTITFDNGTEGMKHIEMRKMYDIETYHCDPFASWQKGAVENINKMIRYYLPRKTDMSKISQSDIYTIQEKLNNMPRKSLNYQSPNEVINNYLKSGAMKT